MTATPAPCRLVVLVEPCDEACQYRLVPRVTPRVPEFGEILHTFVDNNRLNPLRRPVHVQFVRRDTGVFSCSTFKATREEVRRLYGHLPDDLFGPGKSALEVTVEVDVSGSRPAGIGPVPDDKVPFLLGAHAEMAVRKVIFGPQTAQRLLAEEMAAYGQRGRPGEEDWQA